MSLRPSKHIPQYQQPFSSKSLIKPSLKPSKQIQIEQPKVQKRTAGQKAGDFFKSLGQNVLQHVVQDATDIFISPITNTLKKHEKRLVDYYADINPMNRYLEYKLGVLGDPNGKLEKFLNEKIPGMPTLETKSQHDQGIGNDQPIFKNWKPRKQHM